MFTLNEQLKKDTVVIGRFPLCLVLLMKDANYPWCILVPQRTGVTEMYHLSEEHRLQLMNESCRLSEVMTSIFSPKKMNVAALGNMVSQLHIHHVARFEKDAAWPQPVWGATAAKPYKKDDLKALAQRLRTALSSDDFEVLEANAEVNVETPYEGDWS